MADKVILTYILILIGSMRTLEAGQKSYGQP